VILGTLEHCFVLNTTVNSMLNKFITSVAPPSDKVNNSVFHLQNQARPLHSKFQVPTSLKYPHQFAQIFGTVDHRDILICPLLHFHQLPIVIKRQKLAIQLL